MYQINLPTVVLKAIIVFIYICYKIKFWMIYITLIFVFQKNVLLF